MMVVQVKMQDSPLTKVEIFLDGNISHDGTITTDITSNNTGHDFRLNLSQVC